MSTRYEAPFEVERVEDDVFAASLGSFGGRSFGGEILGCATLAVARTCEGRALHAASATFLRPVPPETQIELRVERLSDGRRMARRRLQIRTGEHLLFELVASFAEAGGGPEFQDAVLDAALPSPDELPPEQDVAKAEGWTWWRPGPLEWRWLGTPWRHEPGGDARYRAWVRPSRPLPDDPGRHAAMVAFLSDYHSHWPVARKTGRFEPQGFVSLDQTLWLHRDLPWDGWRLITSECDVAHGGRAFSRRMLHAADGRLVASMAQEALIPGPE